MEGGSVLFVAVNKDVCPSQISSGLMSNSLGPGLSKTNTPTALPRPSQMNRAFLASGPPALVSCLPLREGRKRAGEQASIGDTAHEDLRNSVLSIFNLQMSIPQKSACKTG